MKATHEEATRLLEAWREESADLHCAFDDKDWSFSCIGRITSTVPMLKLRGAGFKAMLRLTGADIEYECYDADVGETHPPVSEQTISLTLTLPKSSRIHIVGRHPAERSSRSGPLPLGFKS